jgi:hypothetical protein
LTQEYKKIKWKNVKDKMEKWEKKIRFKKLQIQLIKRKNLRSSKFRSYREKILSTDVRYLKRIFQIHFLNSGKYIEGM